MPTAPDCQRCNRSHTRYYRHAFDGGFHVGVYCLSCRTHAQTGRAWYAKTAFTSDELKALPDLAWFEHEADPRQVKLF
jgi:hypothetical protein